jgi:hypothetical protein
MGHRGIIPQRFVAIANGANHAAGIPQGHFHHCRCVDVAVNPRNGLVSAKALAARVLSRAGTASARAKRHPY